MKYQPNLQAGTLQRLGIASIVLNAATLQFPCFVQSTLFVLNQYNDTVGKYCCDRSRKHEPSPPVRELAHVPTKTIRPERNSDPINLHISIPNNLRFKISDRDLSCLHLFSFEL